VAALADGIGISGVRRLIHPLCLHLPIKENENAGKPFNNGSFLRLAVKERIDYFFTMSVSFHSFSQNEGWISILEATTVTSAASLYFRLYHLTSPYTKKVSHFFKKFPGAPGLPPQPFSKHPLDSVPAIYY
jgi:hypothetical protein